MDTSISDQSPIEATRGIAPFKVRLLLSVFKEYEVDDQTIIYFFEALNILSNIDYMSEVFNMLFIIYHRLQMLLQECDHMKTEPHACDLTVFEYVNKKARSYSDTLRHHMRSIVSMLEGREYQNHRSDTTGLLHLQFIRSINNFVRMVRVNQNEKFNQALALFIQSFFIFLIKTVDAYLEPKKSKYKRDSPDGGFEETVKQLARRKLYL
jgi:hypothetical protein